MFVPQTENLITRLVIRAFKPLRWAERVFLKKTPCLVFCFQSTVTDFKKHQIWHGNSSLAADECPHRTLTARPMTVPVLFYMGASNVVLGPTGYAMGDWPKSDTRNKESVIFRVGSSCI